MSADQYDQDRARQQREWDRAEDEAEREEQQAADGVAHPSVMTLITIEVPFCPVCERPVSEFAQWIDGDRRRLCFRVRCHGEEDFGWLDLTDLADGDRTTTARPFITKTLP